MHISKEKALNLIEHNDKVYHYADKQYEDIVYATTQKICEVVAEMPAADVQPVKRGEWLPHKITASSKCSLCRRVFADETPYCPHCGAKMDGDTE